MRTIYKYPLKKDVCNIIELPLSTKILSVEAQGENIVLYGLMDTEEQITVPYEFRIYGTGKEIEVDLEPYTFLGTVNLYDGMVMAHVFYKEFKQTNE